MRPGGRGARAARPRASPERPRHAADRGPAGHPPRSWAPGCARSSAARAWRRTPDDSRPPPARGSCSPIPSRCCAVALCTWSAAGDLPGAARLLESRERFEAAATRWERAGDGRAAARCRALQEQRRGSMLQAAEDWDALGEPQRAAECRAIHAFREGDYEDAARGYDAAGQPEMAVTSRVFAAKVKMDYEAAERAVEESGLPDMRKALIGDREIWLAQGREMAAARARDEAREARKQQRSTRLSRDVTASQPDDRNQPISGPSGARSRRARHRHRRRRDPLPRPHLRAHRGSRSAPRTRSSRTSPPSPPAAGSARSVAPAAPATISPDVPWDRMPRERHPCPASSSGTQRSSNGSAPS